MSEISRPSSSRINLGKRIKRHVIGQRLTFFATSTPGLETAVRDELIRLSPTVQVTEVIRGGVTFMGRLSDLYRANLHLFCPGRILLRLADFKATNFLQLRKRLTALPWHLYLPQAMIPGCKVRTHRSRLFHTLAIAQEIEHAITAYWQLHGRTPLATNRQTLYVRIDQDRVSLSLDSSGANLYRRGLKTHATRAPLRETTAAAILQLAGYRPDRPLCDPMSGAGTFSLEAALVAKNLAPGARRTFPFLEWPAFQTAHWQHLLAKAAGAVKCPEHPLIWASDIEDAAVAALRTCVARNGLEDAVVVERRDFLDGSTRWSESGGPTGLIVLNPPYGRRLIPSGSLRFFYERIALRLRTAFPGWRAAIIVPERALGELFPFCARVQAFEHGGLRLYLLMGAIP